MAEDQDKEYVEFVEAVKRKDVKKARSLYKNVTTIAYIAAEKGNLDVIRYLTEEKPSILAEKDYRGNTVAHIAAKNGKLDIIKFIAEKEPSELAQHNFEYPSKTALHLAVEKNVVDMETLKFLVEEKGVPLVLSRSLADIALQEGHSDVSLYVVQKKPSVLAEKDYYGRNLAHVAAKYGNMDIIRYAAEKNPSVFAEKDNDGHTPLYLSVMKDIIDSKTFKIFMEDRNISLMDTDLSNPSIAYIAAYNCKWDICHWVAAKVPSVLAEKAPPTFMNLWQYGRNIAHMAARGGIIDIIRIAVEKIPSVLGEKDNYDHTPLYYAIDKNIMDVKTLKFLVEEKGVQLSDTDLSESSHKAAENRRLDIIQYLVVKQRSILTEKNRIGNTLAHTAATCGYIDIIRYVAKEEPSVLAIKNYDDKTPLFLAVKKNIMDIKTFKLMIEEQGVPLVDTHYTLGCEAARNGNLNLLRYLEQRESSIFVQKHGVGESIVDTAASSGHLNVVKYVVDKHPSLLAKNIDTLFKLPASEDVVKISKYLEEKCKKDLPTLDLLDFESKAIHKAIRLGRLHILKYFIEEQKNDVNEINKRGHPCIFTAVKYQRNKILRYLVEERKADLTVLDANHNNILYIAVGKDDLTTLKYVLDERKAPIDINWRNKFGDTLVVTAVRRAVILKTVSKVLKYLVEKKQADVNIPGRKKMSTLHYAASHSNYKICHYLVTHGADPRLKNENGQDFWDIARFDHSGDKRKTRSVHQLYSAEEIVSSSWRRAPLGISPYSGELLGIELNPVHNKNYFSLLPFFLFISKLIMLRNVKRSSPVERGTYSPTFSSPQDVLRERIDSVALDVVMQAIEGDM